LSPGGLASEKDYPFKKHTKPSKCLARKYTKVAWIQDFIMLQDNEESAARVELWGWGGVEDTDTRTKADRPAIDPW
jgi:hypothetical protein